MVHSLAPLVLCGGAVGRRAAALFRRGFRNDNNLETWLDANHPSVAAYRRFAHEFRGGDFVLMAFDHCAADDPRLTKLAERLDRFPEVTVCWSPSSVADMQHMLSGQPVGRLKNIIVPLVGRHPEFSAVLALLDGSAVSDRHELLGRFQTAAAAAGFAASTIHWGGPAVINAALDRSAQESLRVCLPIAGVVMFVVLWWLFGRISLALMVLLCSGLSVLATLAGMATTGHSMNMLLVALPPMILVLNLSYGTHLIHRWQASRDKTTPVGQAVAATWKPSALAALTTAIGAGSLVTSRLLPVRTFGVWAAVGSILAIGLTYLYVPTLLVNERPCRRRPRRMRRPLLVPSRAYAILLAAGLLALVSAGGLARLESEANAIRFLPEDGRTRKDYRLIENRLTGLLPIDIAVETPAAWPWSRRVEHVRALAEAVRRHAGIETAISLADFLRDNPARAGEQAMALLEDDEYRETTRSMLNSGGTRWRIMATVTSDRSAEFLGIVSRLEEELPASAVVTGLVPLIMAAQEEIFRSLLWSFVAAVLLLNPVLALTLRSLAAALVTLVPNVLPVLFAFGLLGWLGQPMDAATLMTASIALGVALDDTMHLISAFRYAGDVRPDASNAELARDAVAECGVPMVMTTLIAGLGLGILGFSSFGPVAHFGRLMAVLLAAALACDLTVMPALLSTVAGNAFRPPERVVRPPIARSPAAPPNPTHEYAA